MINPYDAHFRSRDTSSIKSTPRSATRLDKLREYAEGLWNKALSDVNPDELTHDSRKLQDKIYTHRWTSPLIFDWLYKLLRTEDEKQMNKASDELVKEALESLRK